VNDRIAALRAALEDIDSLAYNIEELRLTPRQALNRLSVIAQSALVADDANQEAQP